MSVRIVETWQHRRAFEIDAAGARAFKAHQFGAANGHDPSARNRQVAVRLEPRGAKRANDSAGEDQIGFHSAVRLDAWM